MILSYDVQNNLDVHSKSGMCQITHSFFLLLLLFSDNHFISKGLAFAVIFISFYTLINLISEVCVCIYFWLFCHDWRSKNEEKKSYYPSVLVAEGKKTPIRV